MKRGVLAALAAAMWLAGCGGGGSLPTGEEPGDGTVPLPGAPVDPQTPGNGNTPAPQSLWPLTPGSKWTYRIEEDLRGVFEKTVQVLGPQKVPDTTMTAITVHSVQPHLEERSWQLQLENGIVVRLREEDLKSGAIARVTTWSPATVKSMAVPQAQGWSYNSSIREVTRLDDGTVEEKDKTYVWTVKSVNETVTVPAGTFTNAIRVERDQPDKEGKLRTYWLVPGIGKVKETGERLEELVSHDIKK
ncbi:MAG TPA: hypothetical protein VF815_24730 [Myxococcaceae bacterium]|jgi:hypothetical protein